jgi:hypothetical protein
MSAEPTFGEHDARCLHSYPPAGIASLNEECRSYEAGRYSASLFVVQAPSQSIADALMAADPYVTAGLYQSMQVHLFKPVLGNWLASRANAS